MRTYSPAMIIRSPHMQAFSSLMIACSSVMIACQLTMIACQSAMIARHPAMIACHPAKQHQFIASAGFPHATQGVFNADDCLSLGIAKGVTAFCGLVTLFCGPDTASDFHPPVHDFMLQQNAKAWLNDQTRLLIFLKAESVTSLFLPNIYKRFRPKQRRQSGRE